MSVDNLQKELKKQLFYDDLTGFFTWLVKPNGRLKIGDIAGGLHHSGYWNLRFLNKNYSSHRLAFLYMTGSIPEYVDHIDGNKNNNSWANLRECTHSQNHFNCKIKSNNTSGYKGVYFRKDRNTWVASCKTEVKRFYLGSYKTEIEASNAYQYFAEKNHGEFFYKGNI
jgi:hypothetical protein